MPSIDGEHTPLSDKRRDSKIRRLVSD
jgi:hypothetical protein